MMGPWTAVVRPTGGPGGPDPCARHKYGEVQPHPICMSKVQMDMLEGSGSVCFHVSNGRSFPTEIPDELD